MKRCQKRENFQLVICTAAWFACWRRNTASILSELHSVFYANDFYCVWPPSENGCLKTTFWYRGGKICNRTKHERAMQTTCTSPQYSFTIKFSRYVAFLRFIFHFLFFPRGSWIFRFFFPLQIKNKETSDSQNILKVSSLSQFPS